ncbi:hypothetical protein PV04_09658 [Phialophora macrospora]|uniref:Uncharacterized protein n=1 Tax=Phialophora macrospora TaxID=1851006 RepID=A0A0D2DRB4_9EURO|nr:hypothetical protein PV04_09658 [Phialophora macrospora]
MYHGHFAAGLLIKASFGPRIPAWPVMFGSSVLDIIGAVDALLGLDVIVPDSTKGPYMYSRFEFIDWDHSIVMMMTWSCVFGWIGCHYLAGFSKEASILGAASTIIHWLMDVLVIEPTGLTIYPHGQYHFGLGLYEKYPVGSWVLECVVCIILAGAAQTVSKERSGADISQACVLLAILSLLMSPWTSPLLLVARIHEKCGWKGYLPVVQWAGFWTAYIVPATIFSRILDKADRKAVAAKKGK